NGLNRFDIQNETFRVYKHDPRKPGSLSGNSIYWIYKDRAGNIWVSTIGGGINRLDREEEEFIHYRFDPDNPDSLSHDDVYYIFEDASGTFWIGTGGGGLNRFDPRTGIFTSFTTRDGLPSDFIYGVLDDEKGNLWISTNRGLSRFNLATRTFRNYHPEDGLQGYEFNGGALLRNKKGEMFFGGLKGLNVFHPSEIEDNLSVPPVVITGFKLFHQAVDIGGDSPLRKSIGETGEIVLSYHQNIPSRGRRNQSFLYVMQPLERAPAAAPVFFRQEPP
ncbi:MAG: histidine kinase, partial [bacterium]|nr:histidine kinase [bacterium]